jgi:hypothetical protein
MSTNTPPLPPLDLQQRYSVAEALAYLRISRAPFYQAVKRGDIPLIKQGKRSFVSGATIAKLSAPPKKSLPMGAILRAVKKGTPS